MKNERILIVEDDVIAQMTLKQMLEDMGYYNISVASSKEEAMAHLNSQSMDAVLLDVFLNGEREGIAIGHTITQQAEAPIIYLTASHDSETYKLMNEIPNTGILEKPYDYDDIHDALSKIFNQNGKKHQTNNETFNEAELGAVFDSISSGICVVNCDKKIVKVNSAFHSLFYEDGDLVGMDIKQVIPDVHLMDRLGNSLSHKSSWEQPIQTSNKKRTVAISTNNYKASNRLYHVITVTDISAQKKNQHKLENQLKQNKILRAEIQHRVRNSLNMMLSFMYLKEQVYEDEKVRRGLKKLRERISTLSKVHTLYFKEDFSETIPIGDFINYIIDEVKRDHPQTKIRLDGQHTNYDLDNSTGIKLGLVINELMLSSEDFHSYDITLGVQKTDEHELEVKLINHDSKEEFSIGHFESKIGYQILKHICGKDNVIYTNEDDCTIKVKIKSVKSKN